jgi:hypothetical protein
MGECSPDMVGTGEKENARGGRKLSLLPCSLILVYQGLEKENLDQKSPGPPGWGLMQQTSTLLIGERELIKSP